MTYLDHNATTPVRPEVVEAMTAVLRDVVGNASSTHRDGRRARAVVEQARLAVAAWLGAGADEIVFVSGGTEGDNLAVRGLALAERARRQVTGHVVSSPLEHPAVLGALDELRREGFAVTLLPVDDCGRIEPGALRAALRADTVLVTLAAANHELGNRLDVAALAAIARAGGALFHCDAVAAAGKIGFDVVAAGVDAATVSAHKIGGPQGAGALFVRRGVALHPVLAGGHQEHERRPGTENVVAIAGFGVAARLCAAGQAEVTERLRALTDRLERRLLAVDGARLHGDASAGARVPGTTNVAFAGAPGQLVAINLDLDGIRVSTGAACTSGSLSPSAVLLALGLPAREASEAVRISLGRTTTEGDVDRVADALPAIVARVRGRDRPPGPDSAAARVTAPARERVLVAMSGGVDSSTAAALLVEAGFDIVGVTLKLTDASGTAASIGGRCCSPRDIADARATAATLGFPHFVLDETAAFQRHVIDDFVDQHRLGRTPNPCVRCNERLKFGPLLAFADAIGAAALATGHYARLARDEGGAGSSGSTAPRLLRALDRDKDQSYFLFGVTPAVLARVRFPLGAMTKADVRSVARRFALPNADKPDSQQICFIPDGDHKAFLESHGGGGRPGIIRDQGGAALGAHAGTHRFTVGQRKGVPGAAGGPRFVLRVEPSTGDVVVGPRAALARQGLLVSDVRWLAAAGGTDPRRCEVQIRHHAAATPAWIAPGDDPASVSVRLDAPALGVAPGQAAVFYDGDRVLGGGWIAAGA